MQDTTRPAACVRCGSDALTPRLHLMETARKGGRRRATQDLAMTDCEGCRLLFALAENGREGVYTERRGEEWLRLGAFGLGPDGRMVVRTPAGGA